MMDKRMPAIGPNPLQEAFSNYQQMEQQLRIVEDELRQCRDMNQDLMRESAFLRSELAKASDERDKYQRVAINLSTRAVMLREVAENLIAEAMRAGANPGSVEGAPIVEGAANRAEREVAAEEEAERLLRSSAKPPRRDILPNAFNS